MHPVYLPYWSGRTRVASLREKRGGDSKRIASHGRDGVASAKILEFCCTGMLELCPANIREFRPPFLGSVNEIMCYALTNDKIILGEKEGDICRYFDDAT